ncbi:hypothetical protein [Myxococcus phage Mx1]|nr:hypothetical protein [Myxococcus phage Mx1]
MTATQMQVEVKALSWIQSAEYDILHNKHDAHGVTDEKGRAVGAKAHIWKNADGKGFHGGVAPTRNGKVFGPGSHRVNGATFEELAEELDRRLVKARAQSAAKFGAKK